MSFNRKTILSSVMILHLSVAPFSYAADTSHRSHPEIEARARNIKSIGLVSPDIKIYELTSGGTRELRDEWSAVGKENILNTLAKSLKEKGVETKVLGVDKDLNEELEDVQALYRAVAASIRFHTYGDYVFPEKQKNFDYSVGPIENVLAAYGVDALIFVYGRDEISTGGRRALMAAGIIAGALTGVMAVPRGGVTVMSITLMDRAGSILWFNIKGSGAGYDLRDSENTSQFVVDMLSGLPGFEK
jgi:hypothetical protein